MFEEIMKHPLFYEMVENRNDLYQFDDTILCFKEPEKGRLVILFYHTERVPFPLDWTYETGHKKAYSSATDHSEEKLPEWGREIVEELRKIHRDRYQIKRIFMPKDKEIPIIKRY